ncbi:MAG: tripartite tricarboxylate transporter permease [Pseudoflavonifractor sp.]|nr:tripartite tricarboxylate transporter permease [Pseudoflavonifractor sp.]
MPFAIGPEYLTVALLGVVIGIVFGAIPGMTATMAVATFLPLTYAYSMEMALYLLLGLYVGGISGGLVPAILINIPGTPSSLCTTFDGHPMALRGESERALKIGITASFIGGMISLGVLAVFTPVLAGWAIKFSAVEKFLIILFALTVIAALSKGQMLRGIWIGMVGVLIALMNQFPVNNAYRMVPDFLKSEMQGGFQLFPLLMGLFAFSQMLEECEGGMRAHYSKEDTSALSAKVSFKFRRDFKGQTVNVIRSALIGTFMGILPGVGGSAASILAYSQAKSWSKHPEDLGTGVPEGLIASETSNNGLTGGALVPLLSLGIPGDSTTAVLIGAFMLQGIQVGPLFISTNAYTWNTILVALLICNVMMYVAMFFPIKLLAKIIFIPQERLYPVVLMMCTVGSYATLNGRMFDVWCLLLFGIVGYLLKKLHFPSTCFLIGFILGGDLEDYFIQAITAYNGYLTGFFVRPMGWVIWALIIISVVYAIMDNRKSKKQEQKSAKQN